MHVQLTELHGGKTTQLIQEVPLISREWFQLTIPLLSKNRALQEKNNQTSCETMSIKPQIDVQSLSTLKHKTAPFTSCTLSPWLSRTQLRLRGDHRQIPSPSPVHVVAKREREEHPTHKWNMLQINLPNVNKFVKQNIFLLPAEKAVCSASREFAEKSGWPSAAPVLQSPPGSWKQKRIYELKKTLHLIYGLICILMWLNIILKFPNHWFFTTLLLLLLLQDDWVHLPVDSRTLTGYLLLQTSHLQIERSDVNHEGSVITPSSAAG